MSRIAVRATPAGIRHVRAGHPWLFEDSIESVSHDGEAGELAVVFDKHRKFAGIGLYDPSSPIRVKVLHHGAPRQIDGAFWAESIGRALDRRLALITDPQTTGYRLIHGENDAMPGLVADRYADVTVLKLYSQAWLPHLDAVMDALQTALPAATVIVRYSRNVAAELPPSAPREGAAMIGTAPSGPVLFAEHGLVMEAEVVRGHKTGYFLDQRDNRQGVRRLAAGARVLDVFSCSGGFSLAAAAGGARSVHSVDLSAEALASAERNFAHNPQLAGVAHQTTCGDAFEVLGALGAQGERYDLVIVDPPSFAPRQANVASALRAYGKLARLGATLVKPGGVYVQSSCSSRVTADDFFPTVVSNASGAGVELMELDRTGHAADHPIGFPEGAYLKTLFARVSKVSGADRAWR